MAKYLVSQFFQDKRGEWHQPGNVAEFDQEEAAVYRARGVIRVYQTEAMTPPETRVVDMPVRRRRNAKP